jgi:hypothetical protein
MSRNGLEFLDWIHLAENREHRVTNLRGLLNSGYFLTGSSHIDFRRRALPRRFG